ncbi:hypothetical protein [Vreelandella venusta]|uniref:hypothetical protein n=1 Tax=Vreelandella venusta TaxID=44935 RepID=UPI00200FCDB3|nr:hypothetical protein [Halomonas venusta]UQI42532.1 hypothetical protein M3L73_09810 [Halomonas venusta]
MIDAIFHLTAVTQLPSALVDEDGSPLLSDPKATNSAGDRLHYVRMPLEQLGEWRRHVTVLAEAQYTGTGTADRVYAQIQSNGDKMSLYSSVYNLDPVTRIDEHGEEYVTHPPFKFGMLAESVLPVPESVSSRQGMQQLIIAGLDELVESAIDGIGDVTQRKLTRAWFLRATEWERDNPQFIGLMQELGLTDQQADDHMRAAALL